MRARSSGNRRITNCSAACFSSSMSSVMLPLVSSMTTTVTGWTSLWKTVSSLRLPVVVDLEVLASRGQPRAGRCCRARSRRSRRFGCRRGTRSAVGGSRVGRGSSGDEGQTFHSGVNRRFATLPDWQSARRRPRSVTGARPPDRCRIARWSPARSSARVSSGRLGIVTTGLCWLGRGPKPGAERPTPAALNPRGFEFVFARLRYDSGDWDYNPKVAANVLDAVVQYTDDSGLSATRSSLLPTRTSSARFRSFS